MGTGTFISSFVIDLETLIFSIIEDNHQPKNQKWKYSHLMLIQTPNDRGKKFELFEFQLMRF